MTQQIKIALIKRNLGISDLAKLLNTTSQNLSGKLKRDNFSEKEIREIAAALDCEVVLKLKLNDTGELI